MDDNLGDNTMQQTPTKRTRNVITSPSVRAANATRSKYRRFRGSPLNAKTRKLLLAKLEREKCKSQDEIIPEPGTEYKM